jgi:6-phosphogluconolactonase
MKPDIRVLGSPMAVAGAAAEMLAHIAGQGGNVALSGGSTPAEAYRLAAGALDDWTGATLWFGDDRAVPPDHPYSNYRMVEVSLLAPLAEASRPRLERIRGEDGADAAAGDYEARVREHLGNRPRLDLALMGLGPDGHTASLFPSKPEVAETTRFVVPVPEAGMPPQVPRVSMTLPIFNLARQVVFLVAGKDKAQAVQRAFGTVPDLTAPAARVQPEDGRLVVLCDEAAAALL